MSELTKVGSRGENVRLIQLALGLTPDGVFGEQTYTAVIAFQKKNGLIADGVVGPATWALLVPSARPAPLHLNNDLLHMVAEPSVKINSNMPQNLIALYNKYGELIEEIADRLLFEPTIAYAIMDVESGGVGIQDGKAIIRFENHIFWRYWGKYNKDTFNEVFRFNSTSPWKDHYAYFDGGWVKFHGNQVREWKAFELARALGGNAAILSISIGLGQLMGFHWEMLGFYSPDDMLSRCNNSERVQVLAFFEYIRQDPRLLTAAQEKDWYRFAEIYNGTGQVEFYATRLQEAYQHALDKLL